MISNPLVYDLSEAVLIYLFMTKGGKCCFDIRMKSVMPGCHHSTSAVVDKHSAVQLLRGPARGLLIRTCEEKTMAREHLHNKY